MKYRIKLDAEILINEIESGHPFLKYIGKIVELNIKSDLLPTKQDVIDEILIRLINYYFKKRDDRNICEIDKHSEIIQISEIKE